MLRWFTTSCKENLITTTVLKISKSITLAPPPPPKKNIKKKKKKKKNKKIKKNTIKKIKHDN